MAPDARALPAAATAPAVDAGEERPCSRNGRGGEASSPTVATASVDLPTTTWSNERRMKRELIAWAKAVASLAIRESMQF
ncbi:hypothetical protein ABZP36_007613 [Zizania latifolia]